MVRQGGLRRFPDRLDLSGGSPGEERLGVDGERNLALRGGVVTTRDLQRSLDALGLYHYLEARGAAVNPNRDPYHLPTCLLFRTATPTSVRAAFASTTRQCKPSLLQPHNRCINNRRQSFQRPRGLPKAPRSMRPELIRPGSRGASYADFSMGLLRLCYGRRTARLSRGRLP